MKTPFLFTVFTLYTFISIAQPRIISGPMLGPVELRDAKIWMEVSQEVKSAAIQYNKKARPPADGGTVGRGETKNKTVFYKGQLENEFNPIQFTVGGLDFNTTYQYKIWINGKASKYGGEFTTKDLWQWRKPPPEFSFLAGGCAFINEPIYDRPGKPYGGDSSIFETMAKEKAAFLVWTGDAWYTREVDYYSDWGLWYRASHERATPVMQNFLRSMSQFGIWDDHDYGPNDIGKNYILKETSREIWKKYWCNPSYGENGQGTYTDDRWWRSDDHMKDSLDGFPNYEKQMLGEQQMEWLKNSLLYSSATFKIIVLGSQVLNPFRPGISG